MAVQNALALQLNIAVQAVIVEAAFIAAVVFVAVVAVVFPNENIGAEVSISSLQQELVVREIAQRLVVAPAAVVLP